MAIDAGVLFFLFLFSAFLHSVCDRCFSFLHHLGSHIPSSGVQLHAGYFPVSIIHRTLTWTTGSLTCVHGLSYAYNTWSFVYTRGFGTPTSQHNLFDAEKNISFSCAPDEIRTLDFWWVGGGGWGMGLGGVLFCDQIKRQVTRGSTLRELQP